MTSAEPDERALEFVDRYLDFLDSEGAEPDAHDLPEAVRAQAFQLLRVLDELEPERAELPAPTEDPIARRFGFGRPEPTITLSTAVLKDAVARRGLQMSELAQRLTNAGHLTRSAELLRFTRNPTARVDRDLAARFAALLDTSVEELEAQGSVAGLSLHDFLALEDAQRIIDAFAREHSFTTTEVDAQVRELLGSGVFRNQTENSWTEALHAALERIDHERH
jgi:ribosome-binding protein aMBF1 (putative translation factor)